MKKWSNKVKTKRHSPPGLFAHGSPEEIAAWAAQGAHPTSSLQYYLNRAGKNLSPSRRKAIERAKRIVSGKVRRENPTKSEKRQAALIAGQYETKRCPSWMRFLSKSQKNTLITKFGLDEGKLLGAGTKACVWATTNGHVVKLTQDEEDAYASEVIRRYQANEPKAAKNYPSLAKVKWVGLAKPPAPGMSRGLWVIVIEKVSPIKDKKLQNQITRVYSEVTSLLENEEIDDIGTALENLLNNMQASPQVLEAFWNLISAGAELNLNLVFDAHAGNWGIRGKKGSSKNELVYLDYGRSSQDDKEVKKYLGKVPRLNPDDSFRRIERAVKQTGTKEEKVALLVERLRNGQVSPDRVECAAELGNEVAEAIFPTTKTARGYDTMVSLLPIRAQKAMWEECKKSGRNKFSQPYYEYGMDEVGDRPINGGQKFQYGVDLWISALETNQPNAVISRGLTGGHEAQRLLRILSEMLLWA